MKTNKKNVADRKLFSQIIHQTEWGRCLGFWASTYEMNPDFVEYDFLPHLFNLGAWDDKNWTSRITLEKKLSELEAASILMDSQCYRGRPRSMRIDLKAAAGLHGIRQHAKVSVIVYENIVRLIIGSANLTDQGYRSNIEIVSSFHANGKDHGSITLIKTALEGAESFLKPWWNESAKKINSLALEAIPLKESSEEIRDWFVWSGNDVRLYQEVFKLWNGDEKIKKLTIVSPFWSETTDANPLIALLDYLNQRGSIGDGMEIHLITDAHQLTANSWSPVLPDVYKSFHYENFGVRCFVQAIDPRVQRENVDRDDLATTRKLHAKVVVIESDKSVLTYTGSANFTSRGWGFISPANIEAGIISRRLIDDKMIGSLIPNTAGKPKLLNNSDVTLSQVNISKEGNPWPRFIVDARLETNLHDANRLDLLLRIEREKVEQSWSITLSDEEKSPAWKLFERYPDSAEDLVRVELTIDELNQLIRTREIFIRWWESEEPIAYPLNLSLQARDSYPISPESGHPNEQMLLAYYQGRIAFEEIFPLMDHDNRQGPQSQIQNQKSEVDTSGIQSYQIREFVESLDGIRDDLRSASESKRTMRLALHSSVSPVALAELIAKEVTGGRRTPVAGAFQLVELLACLHEFEDLDTYSKWKDAHTEALRKIESHLDSLQKNFKELDNNSRFKKYYQTVLTKSAGGKQA